MSVVEDKSTNRYYISYHITYPDGSRKTINIKKAEWSFSKVGKRYMRSIEASEIEADKAKRLSEFCIGRRDVAFATLCEQYCLEQERTHKLGTSYAKRHIVSKHILPCFRIEGEIKSALTPETCRRFKEALWGKELTAEHKSRVLRVMREICEFAADNDLISYDSSRRMCRVLSAPRTSVQARPEHEFWTPDEYQAFRDTFTREKDWKWGVFFDVVYYGALRLGEALALKWRYVDFAGSTIFINEAMDNAGHIGTPKNASSRAKVSLPKFVMDELGELRNALFASNDELVFFGDRTSRTSVRRYMDAHIAMAGVKDIRVHDLRHSMASRLINMGVNPLVVSKHLRHSSTQQTLDTYSHLFPSLTDGLMDMVAGNALQRA